MNNFRAIQLTDREAVERIRKVYGVPCAAQCFAALYIWRVEQKLSICLSEEYFAVLSEENEVPLYTALCGRMAERVNFLRGLPAGAELAYQTDQDQAVIEQALPGAFSWQEDAASAEYIYSVQEQANLKGGKFSGMRSKIHKALRDHAFTIETITSANLARVSRITEQWNASRSTEKAHWFGDAEAAAEAIAHFFALGLSGVLIRDEKGDVGYVFGSELSPEMFDVHCSKVNILEDNVDLACKYLFYRSILGKYGFVNREEDLGLSGLRMRKISCQPVSQIRMWKAVKR